jgi:hypothetical protein
MSVDVFRFMGSWFTLDNEVGHAEPGNGYAMFTHNGLLFLYQAGEHQTPTLTSCFVPMAHHDAVHLLRRRSGMFRLEWERSGGAAS